MSNFEEELNIRAEQVNSNLESYFNRKFDSPDLIENAVKYSLFSPGKKIRPVLVLEVANLLGENPERVIPFADAIEMIHTYSLIHDDLPAMDDDDLRRGKPTNHKIYGEGIATLAGDALLNMAMERILEGVPEDEVYHYLEAARILFYFAGINGMIGGQTADIISDDDLYDERKLSYIHSHKTGALINAAVLCGAIPYIGKSDPKVSLLFNYANCLGKIFQIVDDILDIEGNAKEMGKNIGSDEKNKRANYVSIYGLGAARGRVEELRKEAFRSLDLLGGDNQFLKDLTNYLCDRSY